MNNINWNEVPYFKQTIEALKSDFPESQETLSIVWMIIHLTADQAVKEYKKRLIDELDHLKDKTDNEVSDDYGYGVVAGIDMVLRKLRDEQDKFD